MSNKLLRPRAFLTAVGACAALAAATAPSAGAALITTGSCDDAQLSEPFAAWGDGASYKLLTGGDFEGPLSGWTLNGSARVAGSEPYGVSGHVGAHSLSLPAGASALSPLTCVNASYPTARFFARSTSGATASLVVTVSYKDPLLGLVPIPAGAVVLSGSWQPTLPMLTASAIGGLLAGGTGQVALNFSALSGAWQIDDVYIDPYQRG
jgi:hypothetical protein